jgi:predicted transcriptional regulator
MRRSHLEKYIEIIGVLEQNGPLKRTPLMYKANLNCSNLKDDLSFLVKQGLIEELTDGKAKRVFAITNRGINVLKYFQAFKHEIPAIDDTKASHAFIEM